MAKGDYKIPFSDGNQLDYPNCTYGPYVSGVGCKSFPCEMVDNFEFEDTLKFESYGKGRSSVTFNMRRQSNGKKVTMFLSDFAEIVPFMVGGCLYGLFTFTKRGQNYGCKRIGLPSAS